MLQVFAFYLGCQPSVSAVPEALRLGRAETAEDLALSHSSNDPQSIDADMFQNNLENLEKTCENLTEPLLKVTLAFMSLKNRMLISDQHRQSNEGKKDLEEFVETIEETKGEMMTNTAICIKRREAVVSLMEDGFGERTWSFRTASH